MLVVGLLSGKIRLGKNSLKAIKSAVANTIIKNDCLKYDLSTGTKLRYIQAAKLQRKNKLTILL